MNVIDLITNLKDMINHEGAISGWAGNQFNFQPYYANIAIAALLAWAIQRKLTGGILGFLLWVVLTVLIWGGLVSLGI